MPPLRTLYPQRLRPKSCDLSYRVLALITILRGQLWSVTQVESHQFCYGLRKENVQFCVASKQPYHTILLPFFPCLNHVFYSPCSHSQPAAADPGLRTGAPDPAAAEDPGALSGSGCNRGSYHLISNSAPFTYQQFARISVISVKRFLFFFLVSPSFIG